MSDEAIEGVFPNLVASGYRMTSPATQDYNCIAWAAGVDSAWWWPDEFHFAFWPVTVPRTVTLDAFLAAYETLGYIACADGQVEYGYEKIALYGDKNQQPTHAARQVHSGKWTSKLGPSEDIEHNTVEALHGDHYGGVLKFMKRPLRSIPPRT